MATYVNDLRLKEIATGDEEGTWGASTNTNLELIGEAFSYGTLAISGSQNLTITDGGSAVARSLFIKITGTLSGNATLTIDPNTVSKVWAIQNATSGGYSLIISQGSGSNVTIPASRTKILYSDGGGSSANIVEVTSALDLASFTAGSTTLISSILDEDNMASDSATALATQQSIKAYVDTQLTAEDLDFAGDSGSGSVDLDSQTFTIAGTSNEVETSGSGQTLTVGLPSNVTIGNNLTVTNDLDVDGTTNLDAVDVDGSVQIDATVTVGVDDTGYDVKFFGATSGAYMLWDESADDLVLAGAAGLDVAGDIDVDGTTNLDAVDIDGAVDMASTLTVAGNVDFNGDLDVDGTTNLDAVDIDGAVQIDSTVTVGVDDTGYDVKFFGATSGAYMLWDESADDLVLAGAAGLDVAGDIDVDGTTNLDVVDIDGVTTVGGNILPDANETIDIGATGTRFNDIWASYLYLKRDNNPAVIEGIRNDSSISSSNVLLDIKGEGDLGSGSATGAMIRLVADETWAQGSDSGGHIRFSTTPNNSWDSPTERVRIDNNGRVGIGTTDPDKLLEIAATNTNDGIDVSCYSTTQTSAGTIRLAHSLNGTVGSHTAVTTNDQLGRLFFAGSDGSDFYSGAAIIADATQNYTGSNGGTRLEFWTTPNNTQSRALAMTVDDDGKVGIGTVSPDALLHVEDGTNISMSSSADGQIKIGGSAYNGAIALDGSNMSIYHNSSSRGLVLGTNETARLTITGGGNVGIGTTSPGTVFHVQSSSANPARIITSSVTNSSLLIGNTSTGSAVLTLDGANGDAAGADYFTIQQNNDLTANIYTQASAGVLTLGSKGTSNAITIDGDNVGIGTTSPAVRLHAEDSVTEIVRVKGSGTTAAVMIDADGGGSSGHGGYLNVKQNGSTCGIFGVTGAYSGNTNADVGIFAESGRRIEFAVNGSVTPVMVVHSGGNIGMGTISPDEKLEVDGGSSYPNIKISSSSNTSRYMRIGMDDAADHVVEANGVSTNLVFKTVGTERMRIDSSGNAVIGRASASAASTDAGHVLYGAGQHYIFSNATQCVRFYETSGSGQQVGSISITSSATSFNTSSDQRLKDNITDAPSASDDIDAIRIRSFDWKADGSHQKYGIVAQELIAVTPAAVNQPEDADEMMGIDYSKLVPMLIKEIQSLRDRVASLETN